MSENHTFPWGIYIGDLIDNNDTIPLCLDSKQGGFCVLFDESSEQVANNFIENVALKLFEVIPIGNILVDIFDFGHKKRFMYLSSFANAKLYDIAYSTNSASIKFSNIEEMAFYRHHKLLSFESPTVSDYNRNNLHQESYYLLLIHLDDFPDEVISPKRIKNFFESAYEAGFYIIFFGNKDILKSKTKTTQYILNKFPNLFIDDNKVALNQKIWKFMNLTNQYEFHYLNDEKDKLIKNLLVQLEKEQEQSFEQNFLSVPIGTSFDGRDEISFCLGDKSENYHAFITGVSGSGKTTLLNNIILGIAEKYTSNEIRLYLMDYKEGVEFQVFRNHPNCEKIFLDNEDIQASITLLEKFTQTIKERGDILRKKGIKDLDTYNTKYPESPIYRIVLIIDEVQRLFSGGYKEKEYFNKLLKQVVRQGRSFGVHIILSTQTLQGANIDKELMSQITLRISYKLADETDASKIFNYENTKEVLGLKKYHLIYNGSSGHKEGNVLCRVNPPKDIENVIKQLLDSMNTKLILKPEIVKSKNSVKNEYETNSQDIELKHLKEKNLLAKLRQEGKIK